MHITWQKIQTSAKFLKPGEYSLFVREIIKADAPAVLLVHGLGVSSEYYADYAQNLAKYYSVYAVDLPGYGHSPKPSKVLDISKLSTVLIELVDSLELQHCVIIGQSMGCQVAAHALVSRPDLFRKAVLIAPTANADERSVLMQGARLFQDTFKESIHANTTVFKNYMKMGPLRFMKSANYMVRDHIEDTLNECTADILFVVGSHDKIAPRRWAEAVASYTKNGTVTEIYAPHLAHMQHPVQVASITQAFINS